MNPVPAPLLRRTVLDVLTAWDMPADLAGITAEVLVDTDLAGIDSHGVQLLPTYERLRGELDLRARPTTVRENRSSAVVDAGHGLGHPAADFAMRLAIRKAAETSVGVASVVHSHHFGAAGYYAALAAEHGMLGMVTSSANLPLGVPPGGRVPVPATNPIAFAAPTRRNPPFLLDMATTTVAANKVRVHGMTGRPLPPGWVFDAAGEPAQEAAALDGGGLSMLGGTAEMSSHKGYGLAMMAHILAATLVGGAFPAARPDDEPHDIGHFFLALDPAAFRADGRFRDDLDDAIDLLHATPPADPDRPVLVAGDPQAQARKCRTEEGIPLPDRLVELLRGVCSRAGVTFALA